MADFPSFTQNFTLTRCSTLTLNMIPAENKNTIHFKHRLLPNYLPHDLEIVTVNGGEGTSQYHTELAVAKFTGKRKKIPSGYFITTPDMVYGESSKCGEAETLLRTGQSSVQNSGRYAFGWFTL